MDPFSALGLASNIISLVDFTCKLVAGTQAIYQSQSGTSEENAVLETITRDIRRLGDAIVIDDSHSGALHTLAMESKSLADQLLHALDKLRAKSRDSSWASFKAALRDVWSRSEIQALYRRLSELQRQITSHIQYLMGDRMSEISVAVRDLLEANTLLRLDLKKLDNLEKSMGDIMKAMQPIDADIVSSPWSLQYLSHAVSEIGLQGRQLTFEHEFLRSIHFTAIESRQQSIPAAHAHTYSWIFPRFLAIDSASTGLEILPHFITQKPQLSRQESSEDSRCKTLTSARFGDWLEHHNGIFWVEGKAGSGKSTLMKFISGHDMTNTLLLSWAKTRWKTLLRINDEDALLYADDTAVQIAYKELEREGGSPLDAKELEREGGSPLDAKELERLRDTRQTQKRLKYETDLLRQYPQQEPDDASTKAKLVIAKCFFWNPGSRLQKSLEGLLRCWLFDILRQCPEIVTHARASSNDPLIHVRQGNWTLEALTLLLEECITVRISASFCLFVDGLDEFHDENRNTFRHLIHTLNRVAAFPNVKIYASSRPWTVFLDSFGVHPERTFRLEDLTRDDIRKYVTDNFKSHDQYGRLSAFDHS